MRNSVEVKDEKRQLKEACFSMLDVCKSEIRDFTEEEQRMFDSYKEKIEALNAELRDIENELNKPIKNMEKTEFRLLKAIRDIANNREMDEAAKSVCERGANEMRKAGVSYAGQIQLPVEETRADITIGNDNAIVGTDIVGIIAPLRAKNVLIGAGARFLSGLVGDVQLPVMGAGNVAWEGETAAAPDAGYTFAAVKLSPKRLTAYVDVSKQFLNQDSVSAEMLIREDLVNAINSKLEQTILGAEAGSTTQPAGIFYNGGAALSDLTNYKSVAKLESKVDAANTFGEKKYIIGLGAKAILRTTGKGANGGDSMILANGEIDGTPAFATSNTGDLNVAYGDWSMLAIGQWGGIDLITDPYTVAKDGKVRLVVNAYFDAKVLVPTAIAVAKVKE